MQEICADYGCMIHNTIQNTASIKHNALHLRQLVLSSSRPKMCGVSVQPQKIKIKAKLCNFSNRMHQVSHLVLTAVLLLYIYTSQNRFVKYGCMIWYVCYRVSVSSQKANTKQKKEKDKEKNIIIQHQQAYHAVSQSCVMRHTFSIRVDLQYCCVYVHAGVCFCSITTTKKTSTYIDSESACIDLILAVWIM